MTTPFWLIKTWAWLKKYWKWLLFPIGALLYIIGRASARRDVTVVSPGLAEHQAVREKLDAEAAQQKQEVDAVAAKKLEQVELERQHQVDAETKKQVEAVDAAQGDPGSVNDLLKQVGKDLRK